MIGGNFKFVLTCTHTHVPLIPTHTHICNINIETYQMRVKIGLFPISKEKRKSNENSPVSTVLRPSLTSHFLTSWRWTVNPFLCQESSSFNGRFSFLLQFGRFGFTRIVSFLIRVLLIQSSCFLFREGNRILCSCSLNPTQNPHRHPNLSNG